MAEVDHVWGPPADGPASELRAARAEAAALRRQVAELEDEVEHLIVGLCHATLHDGRGGRVGLPMLWRSWLEAPAHPTDEPEDPRAATPAAATPDRAR
jgi:hypothetical protein